MSDAPPIEVRGLVKRYGDLVAVDGVDLTVLPGDVFGYLGPNGAGQDDVAADDARAHPPDRGHACGCSGATRRPAWPRSTASPASSRRRASTRTSPAARNLELCAALDGDGARGPDRRGPRRSSSSRDRAKDKRRRLLARDAPAPGHRRGAAAPARGSCCSTSPRPGWTRRACATCALLVRRLADERDDRRCSRAICSPRSRSCATASAIVRHGRDGLRGHARPSCAARRGRSTTCARPTTTARSAVCAAPGRASRTPRRRARRDRLPRAVRGRRSASCRWRWPRRGALVLELAPNRATLEDLFFALTEGDGDARRRPPRRPWSGGRHEARRAHRLPLGAAEAALPEAHLPRPRRRGARADHLRGRRRHAERPARATSRSGATSTRRGWRSRSCCCSSARSGCSRSSPRWWPGDIVAAEDHNGTLKTILTRSVERGAGLRAARCSRPRRYAIAAIVLTGDRGRRGGLAGLRASPAADAVGHDDLGRARARCSSAPACSST